MPNSPRFFDLSELAEQAQVTARTVRYYISQGLLPIVVAGRWNIVIGFGLAMVGFVMTTRWR